MTKKCPECQQLMVNTSLNQTIDEVWTCSNQECGYEERIHLFDKLKKEEKTDKSNVYALRVRGFSDKERAIKQLCKSITECPDIFKNVSILVVADHSPSWMEIELITEGKPHLSDVKNALNGPELDVYKVAYKFGSILEEVIKVN